MDHYQSLPKPWQETVGVDAQQAAVKIPWKNTSLLLEQWRNIMPDSACNKLGLGFGTGKHSSLAVSAMAKAEERGSRSNQNLDWIQDNAVVSGSNRQGGGQWALLRVWGMLAAYYNKPVINTICWKWTNLIRLLYEKWWVYLQLI